MDLAKGLETRFSTGWTRTPIKWANVNFVIPTDVNHNPQPYVAFFLRNGTGEDIVLGSDAPEWRAHGLVMVNIFAPENIGMGLLRQYADIIRMLFLAQPRDFTYGNSGIIRLRVPTVNEIGIMAGWCQVNVLIPFSNDFRL